MLQTRIVPRPHRLARLHHRLEFAIEVVADTGLMDSVLLFFMMVMMAWTMVFPIVRFMPRQMQIRLFTQAGGILRITVSISASMSVFIIPMAITPIMGT
jgi:hypothetical protein